MHTYSEHRGRRTQVPRLEQRAAVQWTLALLWLGILIWAFLYL